MSVDDKILNNTNEYRHLHWWIKKHYGHANKCENPECPGICKKYEWALKHECEYDYDINNFKQLCISCHKKYDMTQERKDKISKYQREKVVSEETKKKLSESNKGKKVSKETREKQRNAKLGKPLSKEHKKHIRESSKEVWKSEELRKKQSDNAKKQWIKQKQNRICAQ